MDFIRVLFLENNPTAPAMYCQFWEEFRKYKPTRISLAMDPEGSGPDTHYKVLKSIAAAVKEWKKEEDLSKVRVIGYRNVWFRYHPADTEVVVPVSLNALAILDSSFTDCYLSQVDASFPSYQLDGKFSKLTQRIWVEQLKQIQFFIGKKLLLPTRKTTDSRHSRGLFI